MGTDAAAAMAKSSPYSCGLRMSSCACVGMVGLLFLEHGLHLAALGAVDARGRPLALPVLQVGVLFFDGLEALAPQGRGLGVVNGALDAALSIGVTHPVSGYSLQSATTVRTAG